MAVKEDQRSLSRCLECGCLHFLAGNATGLAQGDRSDSRCDPDSLLSIAALFTTPSLAI